MNKMLRAAVLAAALVVAVPTAARAASVVDRDFGYGYAKAAGWTRGYDRVYFVVTTVPNYRHFQARAIVRCTDGVHFGRTWSGSAPHRLTVTITTGARCYERLRVWVAPWVNAGAGIYA